ncbi:hypothetical protein MMC11_005409, partial [Xylographa trunciseda]|nr:hypothetical protein [Xylographa trunciseda]
GSEPLEESEFVPRPGKPLQELEMVRLPGRLHNRPNVNELRTAASESIAPQKLRRSSTADESQGRHGPSDLRGL